MSELLSVEDYYRHPRINLTGCVDENMVKDLDMQIKRLDGEPEEPVVVTVSTGGGYVGTARTVYDELLMLQEVRDVTLVARGACMSAGVTIAMAVPRERRLATPNTKFLIHEASLMNSPHITGPLTSRIQQFQIAKTDIEDDVDESEAVFKLIAKGCGQKYRDVEKHAKNGLYLRNCAAVEYGLVSDIFRVGNKRRRSRKAA